jgi:hypothetical protein
MDKKILIGGAVLAGLAFLYFRSNKKTDEVAPDALQDMGEAAEDMGAGADAGAGGGGGGGAVTPSDVAAGTEAKEEVRKAMDMGGIDMASTKSLKSATAAGIATSMAAKGKDVPSSLLKTASKKPLPAALGVRSVTNKLASAQKQAPAGLIRTAVNAPVKLGKAAVQSVKNVAAKVSAPAPIKKVVAAPKKAVASIKKAFKRFDGDDFFGYDGDGISNYQTNIL